ncbi:MAG TPA: TetR/AcrR family transcriptional regulator [Clostridia bacterium]|jgi:AcrR family transcriptional regulator|nr:TetR/AcrR family transcriptional regulator [Clostridia bacterium]HQO55976.1 TetR/AcrR family transcriptional regulator [Clostridia bacterium]
MQSTREKIIQHALLLFSRKGYHTVSVQEIAQAIGIRAPSLYNHFHSKRAIFDAIIHDTTETYRQQAAQIGLGWQSGRQDAQAFSGMDEKQLLTMVNHLFSWFLHEPTVSGLRRMLTLSQFEDRELAALLTKLYMEDPLLYQEQLFAAMPLAADSTSPSPKALALAFYAPIYFLLLRCDREPEYEDEARGMLAEHVRSFCMTYTKQEE